MIQEFFTTYLGKPVEAEDPSNLDQCFDWAFKYCEFLNVPHSAIRHLYAYQIYADATEETKQYFNLIPNTPDNIPQLGDIVVFNTAVGVAGHVCVATGAGDTNKFQSTDQNWNGHKYVEYIEHSYNGVVGWLRPKVFPQDTQAIVDELRKERDNNWNLYQDEVKKNTDLNKQYQDEQVKNQSLREAISAQAKIDENTGSQLIDAQHKVNEYDQLLKVLQATDLPSALKVVDDLKTPNDQAAKEAIKIIEPLAQAAFYKRVPRQLSGLTAAFVNWFKRRWNYV